MMLELEDCPESPDPVKQKVYMSFVAKLQFAASWVRCDIAFTASQLAWFCASVGPSHWAALHHVMGYLEENPSVKLSYQRGRSDGLDGFADSDWGNSITRRSTTDLLARYNREWSSGGPRAEDGIAFDGGSRVLLCVGNGYRGAVPSQSA